MIPEEETKQMYEVIDRWLNCCNLTSRRDV